MYVRMDYMDFFLRLLVAGMLGVLIGLEREYRAKEAGYRTHFLVALGSALIMIVSQYGFRDVFQLGDNVRFDPARLAAQVVTGIGFIGAGTIILQKQVVRGLTTAAGIWATAGIGLAVGAGMYGLGVLATVLVLLGLEVLSLFFRNMGLRATRLVFTAADEALAQRVARRLTEHGAYVVASYELSQTVQEGRAVWRAEMVVKNRRWRDDGPLRLIVTEFPEAVVLQAD